MLRARRTEPASQSITEGWQQLPGIHQGPQCFGLNVALGSHAEEGLAKRGVIGSLDKQDNVVLPQGHVNLFQFESGCFKSFPCCVAASTRDELCLAVRTL